MGVITTIEAELKAAFNAEFAPQLDKIDRLHDRMDGIEAGQQKTALMGGGRERTVTAKGPFLTKSQPMRVERESGLDYNPAEVSVGKLLAFIANPEAVKGLLNDAEVKAYTAATQPGGGLLLPSAIGSIFIDSAGPASQVLSAGALTYQMEAGSVSIPGWDEAPKATFRSMNNDFTDAGGSFREVNLRARDCGAFLDIPSEMMEDAGTVEGVAELCQAEMRRAIAQAIDLAALLSQDAVGGTAPAVPIGLVSINGDGEVEANYGISQPNFTGTNGESADYDHMIDGAASVYEANHTPTACLLAPRTSSTLGKLREVGTGAYLQRPDYLDGVVDRQTGQIGTAYTKGTSDDTSIAIVGDYSKMVIGVRPSIGVIRDPYSKSLSRATRLIVWIRCDVGILDASAFTVIDGLRA